MYLYEIEKRINPVTFLDDLKIIEDCMSNCSNTHSLIGKLFGVSKTENWRQKNNILYRNVNNGSFKLLLKSDIEIDKKALEKYNFELTKEEKIAVNNGDFVFNIAVCPTHKVNSKRVPLRSKEERINWLKYKLTNNNCCEVIDVIENDEIQYNMSHKESHKGSTKLFGYEYTVKIKIKDSSLFKEIIKNGIGPEKAYGFGLII